MINDRKRSIKNHIIIIYNSSKRHKIHIYLLPLQHPTKWMTGTSYVLLGALDILPLLSIFLFRLRLGLFLERLAYLHQCIIYVARYPSGLVGSDVNSVHLLVLLIVSGLKPFPCKLIESRVPKEIPLYIHTS